MANARVEVNKEAAWNICIRQDALYQLIRSETDKRASRANALGAGYKTGKYHKDHKSPAIGGMSPKYVAHTGRPRGAVPVGIVYTGNYAAQKDNMLHNTLLKAKG